MPTVSVIVPVYKVEAYLQECVDSLLSQTFTDFELILVDDDSPDDCPAICDAYAQQDSRVRVIHKKNGGLSAARNSGVDIAEAPYICFVDSDDCVSPRYLEVLYELIKDTTYDFSFCAVHRFPDGTKPVVENTSTAIHILTNSEFLGWQFERKTEFGVWNKLYRKELFDRIRFAENRLNEDVIFSAEYIRLMCNGVIGSDEKLMYYRQRQNGIVSSQAMKGSPDRIYAGEYLLRAVEEAAPQLKQQALRYAIEYPWMFVDGIYVKRQFRENKRFLTDMQMFLKTYIHEYREKRIFSDIQTKRMQLFAKSKVLYAFNAYARLLRVYVYRIFRQNPYKDEHGI